MGSQGPGTAQKFARNEKPADARSARQRGGGQSVGLEELSRTSLATAEPMSIDTSSARWNDPDQTALMVVRISSSVSSSRSPWPRRPDHQVEGTVPLQALQTALAAATMEPTTPHRPLGQSGYGGRAIRGDPGRTTGRPQVRSPSVSPCWIAVTGRHHMHRASRSRSRPPSAMLVSTAAESGAVGDVEPWSVAKLREARLHWDDAGVGEEQRGVSCSARPASSRVSCTPLSSYRRRDEILAELRRRSGGACRRVERDGSRATIHASPGAGRETGPSSAPVPGLDGW